MLSSFFFERGHMGMNEDELLLKWLNDRYWIRPKEPGVHGNDGMLVKRRSSDGHINRPVPREWLDAWISNIVTQESPDFGIAIPLLRGGVEHCVHLRQRVYEWMLGIES